MRANSFNSEMLAKMQLSRGSMLTLAEQRSFLEAIYSGYRATSMLEFKCWGVLVCRGAFQHRKSSSDPFSLRLRACKMTDVDTTILHLTKKMFRNLIPAKHNITFFFSKIHC